ncbi:MAG: hypothetical protein PHE67_03900 [Campylobacterales bacterium]|nr:hypothetical protein [Campylobacterales bacterium]
MQLKVKPQKHTGFFIIFTPLLFLFGCGMVFARFDNGESFLPLTITGVLFVIFGILALRELYTKITQTKEYIFDIDENRIVIDSYVNGAAKESHTIEKSNLTSFEPSYWNNYGAVTTTYKFTMSDGKIITIKEDFGKREKEIFDALITYMYLPKIMIEQFGQKKSSI